MRSIFELLSGEKLSGWRVAETKRKSYELFFVHEKLETVRATDTAETSVTVYADHDGKRGDSSFSVTPAMDEKALKEKIRTAAARAKLVFNEPYDLPCAETFSGEIPTDLDEGEAREIAARIADAVWAAKGPEGTSINALEIFLYREKERVQNSRGLDKSQTKSHVMIEAIPTFTDENGSVELYEATSFTEWDPEKLKGEIEEKLFEVSARGAAQKIEPQTIDAALRPGEILSLFWEIADDFDYASVYQHANLYSVGDEIQKNRTGDPVDLTLCGAVKGAEVSSFFDEDGTGLVDTAVIENGKAAALYGSSRFGQYLGVKKPSGKLPCLKLAPGTWKKEEREGQRYLECASLSGLQIDRYSDYIGGEIRLAYLWENGKKTPVTGVTMSGSLSGVLASLRLADVSVCTGEGYEGPELILLKEMKIF